MAEQVSKQHIQVLCIDDDEIVLRTLLRLLSANNITAKACSDPLEGLKVLATYSFDVIICDMRMPNMDGADFFAQALNIDPEPHRILLTGYSDIDNTIAAVNKGKIHAYIQKPWQNELLLRNISDGIEKTSLKRQNKQLEQKIKAQNSQLKELNNNLEQMVEKRTLQIRKVLKQLEEVNEREKHEHRTTFEILYNFINANPYLDGNQAQNIATTCKQLAQSLGLEKQRIERAEITGYLAQIGLLAMEPELYKKPTRELTENQKKIFYTHPSTAQLMLMPATHLHDVSEAIYYQFEHYNGTGQPKGLKGKEIPLKAMILAVARDFWLAVEQFKSADESDFERARDQLQLYSGTYYHPKILEALNNIEIKCASDQKVGTMKIISAQDLKNGMVLGHALRSYDGILLLPKGHVFGAKSIAKLQQLEARKPNPFRIMIKN
ncbi:response regulator [Pseudoalteromonas sp. 2CM39R]|uniref:HD domain-containing phosphohydrolase n=1 Tax=Pseudoalteromonas sp. 2CM39R TaxID=2929856 RepID=UPI0020BE5574|nr:HD domain-containing phosphohydrolase [Pseudoalteromonas sp. 2CM39R]MCK8123761.1 response regulator [Pseudoalteromonas sp. 2CM39R]